MIYKLVESLKNVIDVPVNIKTDNFICNIPSSSYFVNVKCSNCKHEICVFISYFLAVMEDTS